MRCVLLAIALLLESAVTSAQGVVPSTGMTPRMPKAFKELEKQTKPPSNNWLLDANDDTERFRRLQVVMSGTDIPMWEVTYRYEELFTAIQKNNWELGVYHWDKLRDRMNAAAMKRPARTQNIEAMFFDTGVWQSMRDALTSRDRLKMIAQYQTVRQICIGCHIAEKVGFLNDSSVFKRTEAFPPFIK
jgi:hypothetical protein